jgi:hypothetical protein
MLRRSLQITPHDNVKTVLEDCCKGDTIETPDGTLTLLDNVEFGHKVLIKDLKAGEPVIKYGEEIGRVIADTPRGTWIHTHNMSCKRGTR